MDIFFQDPSEIPLPQNEVRIRSLNGTPYPDGRRVRVVFEVDPFQKRPSAEIKMYNSAGEVVASLNVIETMVRKMEFTMHLREAKTGGDYRLEATLFYTQSDETAGGEATTGKLQIVDQAQASVQIPDEINPD